MKGNTMTDKLTDDKPSEGAMRAARAANIYVYPGVDQGLSGVGLLELAAIIDRETGLAKKNAALQAVLMFHSGEPWDYVAIRKWFNLTQSPEATTKVLCDRVRKALKGV